MPSESDMTLTEMRLFDEQRERTTAYVAADLGVTRVDVSGDRIGRFALAERCDATDIAGDAGRLVVGTTEDVLLGSEAGFVPTGFGPATAVGLAAGTPIAAGNGRLARLVAYEWEQIVDLTGIGGVTAIDGDLVGTDTGLFRLHGDSLSRVEDDAGDAERKFGDAEIRAVAAEGPIAGTESGAYVGYNRDVLKPSYEGNITAVGVTTEWVFVATPDSLRRQRRGAQNADWQRCNLPVEESVVAVVGDESPYAVTENGTFLVDAAAETTADGQGGWRARALGVRDVVGLAVP